MERAKKVLIDKIQECENMHSFYENELNLRFNHITADQSEKSRLQRQQSECIKTKEECEKALEILG